MIKQKQLTKLLCEVKDVLDSHNVEFWLECGTLLGAMRDGKFIPWEHDIDFGVWQGKVDGPLRKEIADSLRKKGFKVWIAENHMNIRKAEVYGDINFYHQIGNNAVKPALFPKNLLGKFLCAWLPVLSDPYHPKDLKSLRTSTGRFVMKVIIYISRIIPVFMRNKLERVLTLIYKKWFAKDISWKVPIDFFSELDTINFCDMELNVPHHPEEYLSFRYGKNWRTPCKIWATEKQDGAIITVS